MLKIVGGRRSFFMLAHLAVLLGVSVTEIFRGDVSLFLRPMNPTSWMLCAATSFVSCTHWAVIGVAVVADLFFLMAQLWGMLFIRSHPNSSGTVTELSARGNSED